jgi:cytoskeletal protein RodZ
MGSVASDLKVERERRKITLAQIAAESRISRHFLESLEEGRFSELPGGIYNRAFIRAYCENIGVDPHEILRRYEAELSPAVEKSHKPRKSIPQQNPLSRHYSIIAWTLMLLISATGLFFSRKWIASVFSPYFSHTPAVSVRYEPPVKPALPPSQPALPVTSPASEPSASEPSLLPANPIVPAATQTNATTVPLSPEAALPLRLDIEVTEECWISIESDGQTAVRRLLVPGEAQTVGATEQFTILVGNAGGIRLKINGKPARPLGKSGDVVRVLINDKNLQDFIDQTSG